MHGPLEGPWVRGALLLVALLGGAVQVAAQEVPEDAYAVVGSTVILRADVDADAARGIPAANALQRRVQLEALRARLVAQGEDPAKVGDKELDEGVAEAEADLASAGAGNLEQVLARTGQTLEQFRAGLRVSLAFRTYVRKQITDEALKADFPRRALRVAGEVRVSHILLRPGPKRDRDATEALAEEHLAALAKVGAGELAAAFAKLAAAASEDAAAALTGGDLDWLRARTRAAPPGLVDAAFARGEVGLIEQPVWSVQGCHVVLVTDVHLPKDATPERLLPPVRADAEGELARELLQEWLKQAKVRYAEDAPRLRSDPAEPRGE